MKRLQKITCLTIFLLSLLSVSVLQAQQYEVTVKLGNFNCGNQDDLPRDVSGTITVGPTGNETGTGLSQSFNETSGSYQQVFFGVFNYLPTNLNLVVNESLAQVDEGENPELGCTTGIFNVSQSLVGNGLVKEYTLIAQNDPNSQDPQQSIVLEVTIEQTGLNPGVIGSNQTICEYENPETLSGTDASGASPNITYRWEYSNTGHDPWLPALESDGSPATDETYTPARPDANRWYRRVAISADGSLEEPSNAVIIELATAGVERHFLRITVNEYRCSGSQHSPFLSLLATIDGMGFEGNGTPADGQLVVPFIQHEFTERPQTIEIDASRVLGGDESIPCVAQTFTSTINLDQQTTDSEIYTITNGVQELDILVEINSTGQSMIDGGEIGQDQVLCIGGAADDLTEVTAPVGATNDDVYRWEFSTNAGNDWELVTQPNSEPVATPGLPLGTVNTPTWYRRVIYRGCSKGVSNVVRINFELPVLPVINGPLGPYRVADAAVELTASPGGGVFTGNGVSVDGTGKHFFTPSAAGPGEHTVGYNYTSGAGCLSSAVMVITVEAEALCSSIVPLSGSGQFEMDNFSGRIIYRKVTDDCTTDIPVSCIAAEPDAPVISQVVQASAATLSDEWDYSSHHLSRYETALQDADAFETGILGKWRGKDSYVYNTSLVTRDKNYNTGTFDMSLFNWRYDEVNQKDRWIQASTVSKYSPHGEALEEFNAIGIASAVKMGYYDNVPYLTAQNAIYESVFFESFEETYGENKLESGARYSVGGAINSLAAHAGHQSLSLDSNSGIITSSMKVAREETVMMMQVWVKGNGSEQLKASMTTIQGNQELASTPMTQIARSGDWGLYQALLNTTTNTDFQMAILNEGGQPVRLDDMRIQPIDAEMTCYVYDPATLRLLTVFDGQHFGLYYQYDGEGKLVRKTIETERGTRTLQETFYNVPKVDREHE